MIKLLFYICIITGILLSSEMFSCIFISSKPCFLQAFSLLKQQISEPWRKVEDIPKTIGPLLSFDLKIRYLFESIGS